MFCAPSNSHILQLLNCDKAVKRSGEPGGRGSAQWQLEERGWLLRNGSVLRMLARMVNKPLAMVHDFLFGLTLRKFGEIMNPKCTQWNLCRVPLVRGDICGIYDAIYDQQGDLRPSMEPYILELVINILEHFLNLPCDTGRPRRPGYDLFESRKGPSKCRDFYREFGGLKYILEELTPDEPPEEEEEESSSEEEEEVIKKKKKKRKRKRKRRKKEKPHVNYYMGVALPVLAHEPFDPKKPWTWIRRHPLQTRVLEGTDVGHANVTKYKDPELKVQLTRARDRTSVSSMYDVDRKDHPSLVPESKKMFTRKTLKHMRDVRKTLYKK